MGQYLDEKYAPLSSQNTPIISIVSVGEIKSIAIQNKWGKQKFELLAILLDKFVIASIDVEDIIEKYTEIDAFSQGRLPSKPSSFSSRNMGKNDLWIAATASILEAQLLTTDKDFEHLSREFINLEIIILPKS